MLDPTEILRHYHKNCIYQKMNTSEDKSLQDVSTQSVQSSIDAQIQVSFLNESKDTQTNPKIELSTNKNQYQFINPYALIDRVHQGKDFLKFLHKQNVKLDVIYTNFLQNLQKYADDFLLSLQREHVVYGSYRHDVIWYITVLQDYINHQRTKVKILQEANRNLNLFQKHFHRIVRCKYPLEEFLEKFEKFRQHHFELDSSNSNYCSSFTDKLNRYQHEFFKIYQTSSIQLRMIEQQRLLTISEQMRLTMNLTMNLKDSHQFSTNHFEDLLDQWDDQHRLSLDHWAQFPRHEHSSIDLLNEIKQVIDQYYSIRRKETSV